MPVPAAAEVEAITVVEVDLNQVALVGPTGAPERFSSIDRECNLETVK